MESLFIYEKGELSLRKTLWWTLLLTLGMVLLATGCGGASTPSGEDGDTGGGTGDTSGASGGTQEIRIGMVNWAEDIAVSHLWKVILEQEGYQVTLQQLDAAPLYTGLANGDLDVFLDAWLPITHEAYWEKYKDQLEDYGIWYGGQADLGLAVPTYVEEVNSIEDLEAHKDLFNGEITGIDAGAGLMRLIEEAVIPEYGLSLKLVASSESAMLSALDNAVKNQEPIVIAAWRPHWMFTEWDLKYLEDPKKTLGEPEEIHTLANKDFAERHPEVASWLKNFKMTDEQLGTLESYIFNEGMAEDEAAKRWIEENRNVVDGWLGR